MGFLFAACGKKTIKLELPEGITLVDSKLNADKLKINSEVEIKITPPSGKELKLFKVNDTDRTEEARSGKITIKIVKGLKVTIDWKEKETPIQETKYTVTLGENLEARQSSYRYY